MLAPLQDALFVESNPVPLKAALDLLDLASCEVRLPLLRAADKTRETLAAVPGPLMKREEWTSCHRRYALASQGMCGPSILTLGMLGHV